MSPQKQAVGGPVPITATIAVVVREDKVLLVRTARRPDGGKWGFPGRRIKHGESLHDTAVHGLFDETGIHARPERVLTAIDAFDRDGNGTIHHHLVLIAVLCIWISGEPAGQDGIVDARWHTLSELESQDLALSFAVADVARQALVQRQA